ncbi:MAG: hypothetical protein RJA25_2509 [Bacteroidota bacterium]|jgi:hypothetical protein
MIETFKYNLVNNWNIIRMIRLALSVIIIVQSLQIHDALFGALGVFFLYQALTNTGCCGASGCTPTNTFSPKDTPEEVEFTEIKNQKDANS